MTDITVSAKDVKALRDRTGAGMMDCKKALTETGGDVEAAVTWLREKGIAGAAKLAGREATEGTVQSYIHSNGKVGVLVEVDCNTDFVARNDDFTGFAKEIALQVAAARPEFVSEEEVPEERRSEELRIAMSQMENVPEQARERAAQGKLGKWLDEVVLLRQQHVNQDKHGGKTIEQLRAELSAKTGENVVIKRFARFEVGV
ncbi:MAG: translation elongation factor Ts [Actinobacteria bacterium]|nr:MAG: translation elongation factor Ts [Actinomycetota bacterium]